MLLFEKHCTSGLSELKEIKKMYDDLNMKQELTNGISMKILMKMIVLMNLMKN